MRASVLAVALLSGVLLGGTERTWALLEDTAEVQGGSFSVGTLSVPGAPVVTGSLLVRQFSWTPAALSVGGTQPPAVRYRVLFFQNANDQVPDEVCSTTTTGCTGGFLGQLAGGQVLVEASWQTWTSRSPRTPF